MNGLDFLLLVLVAAGAGFALRQIRKSKGGCCKNCSGCANAGGCPSRKE